MLQADAEIAPAGDEGERGGGPQAGKADLVDPGELRHRAGENKRAERDQLESRLPLGEAANRDRDLQAGEELAQDGDGDLADEDDQGRTEVEIVDHRLAAVRTARDQQDAELGDPYLDTYGV